MYLHLGKNTAVDTEDIIAILDMDNITISKASRDFLKKAEEKGLVVSVTEDLPKSVILVGKGSVDRVYITNISSKALGGRAERLNDFSPYALPDFEI